MGWTIIPTDGVEDKGNGKYVFTPQSQDTTYIITYTDGETSGTIEYTVKATDCMVCDCSKFTFTKIVSQIPAVGYDTDTLIGTLTGACISNSKEMDSYISPVVTEGNNAVESVSTAATDENTVSVYARIKSNPGDTRTIKIRFDITNSYMAIKESCPTEYSFTQAANGCYSEPAPTVSPNLIDNVPSDGGNYDVTYQETDCWIIEKIEYDEDIIETNGTYNFDVYPNPGSESRETTLTYTFRNRVTNLTSDSEVKVRQLANACANTPDPSINPTEYTVASVGSQSDRSATWRPSFNRNCWTLINVTDNDSCIENITFNQESVTVRLKENSEGQLMTSVHNVFRKYDGTEKDIQVIITQIPDCTCNSAFNYSPSSELPSDTLGTAIFGFFTVAKAGCDVDIDETTGNIKAIVDSDSGGILNDGKLHVDYGERGGYVVKGYITPNTLTRNKTLTYHLRFMDTNCDTQSITQPFGCTCNSGINYYPVTELPSEAASNVQFGYFTTNASCDIDITEGTGNLSVVIDSDPGGIVTGGLHISTNHGAYIVTGNVTSNITSEKTIKYHLKLDDTSCNQQTATQPVGISCCDVVTFDIGRDNHLFDMDAATVILDGAVLTINNNSCSINDFSIIPYPSSGLTSYQFTDNHNNTYGLTLELPTVTEPEVLILKLMHQGSHDCNKSMMIYRRCYCGSDNCRNVYRNPISGDLGDIVEDNPIYLRSYYPEDETQLPYTFDTFFLNEGDMYEDAACTIPINSSWVGKTVGWCTATYAVGSGCWGIKYTAQKNTTNSERTVSFTYYTKPNTHLKSDSCLRDHQDYAGKPACTAFTVTIYQAAYGYLYTDCNKFQPYGIDPETGRHYRMQCLINERVQYEGDDGQTHDRCDCSDHCGPCNDL